MISVSQISEEKLINIPVQDLEISNHHSNAVFSNAFLG
jgi:hypothetical protein